jgi:hypothetical protein
LSYRRAGFDTKDKETVARLLGPFDAFLNGREVAWGMKSKEEVRKAQPDETVVVMRDERWDEGQFGEQLGRRKGCNL